MEKGFSLKRLFIRMLLLLPLVYIGFGWYIGLNYGQKPVVFGPYPDIPMGIETHLLGQSLKDITGSNVLVMVVSIKEAELPAQGSTYFRTAGYLTVPQAWAFEFPPSYGKDTTLPRKRLQLTGSYSRAIAYELKNPGRKLGSLTVEELHDFLKATGRTNDVDKLRPYLILANLEEKYPWLYSGTVLLSKAMGYVWTDNFIPYDILGLTGILVLFVALSIGSIRLWVYYLFWVFAYWFGRIGYHDPVLSMSNDGWQVILWSFWNGFIQQEGRLFLLIALVVSAITFGVSGIMYLTKHIKQATTGVNLCRCRI